MAQPKFNCFAVVQPGCEQLCAAEIAALGLSPDLVSGGVAFSAVARDLYRVNLWSRVASRVLVRLGTFSCRDFPELYRQALRLPWGRFVRPGRRCRVRVSCQTSRLNHSGRIAETLLAAMAKVLGGEGGELEPEQLIFVRLENDRCVVSVDSSGELLHRRGYRRRTVAAPLRENLAAAILLKLGFDGSQPLVDAMTGSGSFAIEAALIAQRRAPGRLRRFAFMDWPHYRPHVWTLCLQEDGQPVMPAQRILAIDRNPEALSAAVENAAAAGVEDLVCWEEGRMEDLRSPAPTGLLVCNPPYGERLGEVDALRSLYRDFGELCRGPFRNWMIGWICADRRFVQAAGLGCRRLWSFRNGGLGVDLRLRSVPGQAEKP